MSYPDTYDVLPTTRVTGGGSPAADNNAQAASINAIETRVGIIAPGDSRTLEARLQTVEAKVGPMAPALNYWGFEADTEGWTPTGTATISRDASIKHTSAASLRVVNGATGQSGASATYTGTVGLTYTLKLWVLGDATSTGKFIQAKIGDGTTTQLSVPVKLSSTVWKEVWATFKAAGTTITLAIVGFDLGASHNVWIDDATITAVSTPIMGTLGRVIIKNGLPKRWRGVNHSNVPIGYDFSRSWWQEPKQTRYDMEDIKAMGCDTTKLYHDTYDQQGYGAVLDEAYRNGIDVWMLVYTPHLTDYSVATGGTNRSAQIAIMQDLVNQTKYHPAVVGYGFGNEQTYELGATTPIADWYSLLDAACAAAKAIDPNRLTFTANGDLGNIATVDSTVPNLDVWGANIYRGTGFGALNYEIEAATTKPFIVTEYGYDRYNHNQVTPGEDEAGQALRDLNLSKTLDAMPAISARFLFEWADEWWKESYPTGLSNHDAVGSGPNYNDDRDQLYDEEWFGITEALATGSAQQRVKKQAYTQLQQYQLATNTDQYITDNQLTAAMLANPGGFFMRDINYVTYQVSMTSQGAMSIIPHYVLPATDTANAIYHYDASNVVMGTGSLVTTMTDYGTARKNAIQFNAANQPTLVTAALNGYPILRFGGAGQFMDINNAVLGGDLTIFVVAANQRATLATVNIDTILSSAPSGGVVGGAALATYNFYGNTTQRLFSADYTGGPAPTLWVNTATSPMTLTQGAFKVLTMKATGVTPHNFWRLGLYTDGQLNGQNDIAEIMIFQGLLSNIVILSRQLSLMSKYAIS